MNIDVGAFFESRRRPSIYLHVLKIHAKGSVLVLEVQYRPGRRAPSVAQKSMPAAAIPALYKPTTLAEIDPDIVQAFTAALAA